MSEEKNNIPNITIAAHSGSFHSDDVFAVATLILMLEKKYGGVDAVKFSVVRSRDMEKISLADYVVDVGDVYDPATKRFDHHMTGGAGKRASGVPYAAFGLVWKEYGELVAGDTEAAQYVDTKLVAPIDAVDNGIEIGASNDFGLFSYTIDDFIKVFNLRVGESEEKLDEHFLFLVGIAKKIIEREVGKIKDKISHAVAIQAIYDGSSDKRLINLDKEYSISISRLNIPDAYLIVSPDGLSGNWTIQAVKKSDTSFESKIHLPESWAGKRGQELEKITGVEGSIFCHRGRWIAIAKTHEAAMQLARIALKEAGV